MLNWFKKPAAPKEVEETSDLQQLIDEAAALSAEHDELMARRQALRARIDALIAGDVSAAVAGQTIEASAAQES